LVSIPLRNADERSIATSLPPSNHPLTIPALNWLSVLPTHRRHGIATLLLSPGLTHPSNLEIFLEATAMGKPLYEKHGFRSLLTFVFDMEKKDASDAWRKAQHELTPKSIAAMWRPKGGVWEKEGRVVRMPWDLEEE
jgi:GNAT superfamily N-acetyltransferase